MAIRPDNLTSDSELSALEHDGVVSYTPGEVPVHGVYKHQLHSTLSRRGHVAEWMARAVSENPQVVRSAHEQSLENRDR